MKEKITDILECIVEKTKAEVYGGIDNADANELGEAIDMIKDLSESIYYTSITDAMEESEKERKVNNTYYYTMPYEDYNRGRMYYNGGQYSVNPGKTAGGSNSSRYYIPRMMYDERPWDMENMMMRDYREGRSGQARKMYMESKQMHKDQDTQIKELETYMKELSDDITEMISTATPEEKQILQQKIATLSSKIK